MITNTIENRNAAFYDILDKLPKKRATILQMIEKEQPCTPQEITEKYLYPINEVHPRFNELRFLGFIKIVDAKTNVRSQKKNISYAVTNKNEQINIINRNYAELTNAKDKLVSDYLNPTISSVGKGIVLKEGKKYKSKIKQLTEILNIIN
tara:strand:- start:316 stop:765 length:450 start_codon:yes stop_codon:yes gene_type:complete